MIVADSDVLIDYLERRGAAEVVARELERGRLATTAVSRFELLAGARTKRQRSITTKLLKPRETLPLDATAADQAAAVRRELERRGLAIGMADSLIAGIVMSCGATLLTRNRHHFERVPGLALANLE